MKRIALCLFVLFFVLTMSITAQQKTVTFWTHDSPQMTAYTATLIEKYQMDNPGVKIDYQYIPLSDYETKLMVALTGGTGPDAFDIGDWSIQAYYNKGLLAPIDYAAFGFKSVKELQDAWWPSSLSGFTIKGNVYGMPMEYNTFCLFINKAHFREIGLDPDKDYPKTWKQLGEIGAKLVKKDKNGRYVRGGFDWPHLGPIWSVLELEPIVLQYGGSFLKKDGSPNLNSKEVVQGLKTYAGLIWDYKTGDPAIAANNSALPNLDFDEGKLSMWITGPWAQALFNKITKDEYVVKPLPQVDLKKPANILYAWAWVVNGKAPLARQKEASKWLNFLSSNQAGFLTKCGYLQPRKGWETSKEYKEFPFVDVFVKDMEHGQFMFRSDKWAQLGDVINRAAEKAILNGEDAQKALDAAQAEALRL